MCAVAARLKLLLHYGENIFKRHLNGQGEVYLRGPGIVAEQPTRPPGYFGTPALEQEMDCWVKWIRPVLECFGQHLMTGATVHVDDDGRKETSALAKKYLSGGYRKVQCCLVGDLIFRRKQFSKKSRYWDRDDSGQVYSTGNSGHRDIRLSAKTRGQHNIT